MKWSDPDVEGLIQYMVNDKGFKQVILLFMCRNAEDQAGFIRTYIHTHKIYIAPKIILVLRIFFSVLKPIAWTWSQGHNFGLDFDRETPKFCSEQV